MLMRGLFHFFNGVCVGAISYEENKDRIEIVYLGVTSVIKMLANY